VTTAQYLPRSFERVFLCVLHKRTPRFRANMDAALSRAKETSKMENEVDDIFNDEPQTEDTVEEATVETEVDEPVAEVSEDVEVEAEEAEAEPAKEVETTTTEDTQWTKSMALDERRKRQASDDENRDLRKQLESLQAPKEAVKRPDVFDNQDAAFAHQDKSVDARIVNERINMSREMMMAVKDDYTDMEGVFAELSGNNPTLIDNMRASTNPAKYAYDTAKNHNEAQKLSSPEYRTELKETLRAEILAELKGDEPSTDDVRNKTATSTLNLTKTAANGSNTNPVETLDTISEMFGETY